MNRLFALKVPSENREEDEEESTRLGLVCKTNRRPFLVVSNNYPGIYLYCCNSRRLTKEKVTGKYLRHFCFISLSPLLSSNSLSWLESFWCCYLLELGHLITNKTASSSTNRAEGRVFHPQQQMPMVSPLLFLPSSSSCSRFIPHKNEFTREINKPAAGPLHTSHAVPAPAAHPIACS